MTALLVDFGSLRMNLRLLKENRSNGYIRQVLSAEMRFSADKGLSAERPAGAGFLAEKWRRRQLRSTWGARESNRRPLPPATYALTNWAAPKKVLAQK